MAEVCISPKSERVAWIMQHENFSTFPAFVQRFFPISSHNLLKVWVSRMDGSDMRLIGCYQPPPGQYPPEDFRWMPNGKSLVFWHQGALWKIAAE